MKTYTLKSVVRRGSMLAAAFAIVIAAVAPAASTYADALNPLTDRSLTLSSSSPGWDYKDGSGNSTYAPPNSGANGQKSGNTFAFKVSTNSTDTGTKEPVKAITFQYCTTSAGQCTGPGDIADGGTNAANVLNKKSDLEVVTASPSELSTLSGYVDATSGQVTTVPAANTTGNNYVVYYQSAGVSTPTTSDDTWTLSTGWDMTTAIAQDVDSTGKANQINLVNETGQGFEAGTPVKIVFFGTDTNYITNPGSSWFFVKINTYSNVDVTDPAAPVVNAADVIDGGVTVANVMNQSIQIATKVLETMDFSVGTIDPNTLSSGAGSQLETATGVTGRVHAVCDRILMGMSPTDSENTLKMGNATGEFSLETAHTYSTHSYWRLSSNSSAGATVYYSGNTLSNTVNDKIEAIGANAALPAPGSEQFGLALANGDGSDVAGTVGYKVNYATERDSGKVYEYGADDAATGLVALKDDVSGTLTGIDATMATDPAGSNASYHFPQLYPLAPTTQYGDGAGVVNGDYGSIDTHFAFDETSQTIPVPIATEDNQVVDCVTGKMRYIANIAATTPAGIYTTKINYIAAPQY